MTRYIADINVLQANVFGYSVSLLQGFERSSRQIGQAVLGKEAGEESPALVSNCRLNNIRTGFTDGYPAIALQIEPKNTAE